MTEGGLRVLVVNTGSSSVKLRLLDDADEMGFQADLPPATDPAAMSQLEQQLRAMTDVDVVGHRIVHGGPRLTDAVVVNDAVERELHGLNALAPLHNPQALVALGMARRALSVPQVACFDTAFHARLPAQAATFAVPEEWRTRWGLRRYGFHGLSHSYAVRKAAEMVGRRLGELRVVSCHLGAGASLCAVVGGRSVDTTMGFTPLDGLVMATRSGSIDPGALLWLQRHAGMTAEEVESALEHRSGLLGLSGVSGSPRELYPMADAGHEGAALGLTVYLHRLCSSVAAMAAATSGLDLLVFTGGVGEHSHRLRAEAAGRLAWLGVRVDAVVNEGVGGDCVISSAGAEPAVCVVAAREDLEIARQTRRALGPGVIA